MINRLRRWFYRRIHGEPITPLSVLNSGPWSIQYPPFGHDSVQLLADHMTDWPNPSYGYPHRRPGFMFEPPPQTGGIDLDAWRE